MNYKKIIEASNFDKDVKKIINIVENMEEKPSDQELCEHLMHIISKCKITIIQTADKQISEGIKTLKNEKEWSQLAYVAKYAMKNVLNVVFKEGPESIKKLFVLKNEILNTYVQELPGIFKPEYLEKIGFTEKDFNK